VGRGGAFDPEAFDPDEVNARLRSLYGGNAVEANIRSEEEPAPLKRQIDQGPPPVGQSPSAGSARSGRRPAAAPGYG